METDFDYKDFFMEATLRICGSLRIEKALADCFQYLVNYIPMDAIHLHNYVRETGSTKTFALADKSGGRLVDNTIEWPSEMVGWIESEDFPRNFLANEADKHPIFSSTLKKLNISRVSVILIRLEVEENWIGAMTLLANGWNKFTEEHLKLLLPLKRPFTIALSNNRQYTALLELKNVLADDKHYLQQQLQLQTSSEVVGADSGLRRVMEMVHQVAGLHSPVLLRGETGTGKEVIAMAIHKLSGRRKGPFIKVNCGAIPDSLMDSELFGHEKGAFTGAVECTRGRFERAEGGTIFLDEIGELSPSAQVRLLRVLQERIIERVGGKESIAVDIRIIAATHRDLEAMIRENRFREDLFFRLHVFPILIPPLRHRKDDIPDLVQYFLTKKTRELGFSKVPELMPGVWESLQQYHWPGNVRELENMVERALILNPRGPIDFDEILARPAFHKSQNAIKIEPGSLLINQVVSKHIQSVLKVTNGKINGKNGAAELLGLNASTLRHRLRKMNIPFGRKVNKKNRTAIQTLPIQRKSSR